MISHKHQCIFVHIPKTAGTSIKYLLYGDKKVNPLDADYDRLYGWCPKRNLFMQHATAKQIVELGLVTERQWNTYFKFTFIRNPWERAVSDYFWLMNDQKIKDTFKNYLLKRGNFEKVLNDKNEIYYRGDHLIPQVEYFDYLGKYKLDYVGRFETFNKDLNTIKSILGIQDKTPYVNKSKNKIKHYSYYFNNELKLIFDSTYKNDLKMLGYNFEKQRKRSINIFNK